ncbi:MAG TPA: SigE family RNA polymerase sigma factor [Micromonosporaceae bacterium]|nr:SigE family RNA polymerase sigma factor [Micromonosporaceae bacterium]
MPTPPDGFEEFVTARSPAMLRSAWLLTGDSYRAQDLLQTVLAQVWPRWQRIAAGGNPEAYVRQALFSTYMSWRRRRWRFEVPSTDLPEIGDHRDVAGDFATRDVVRRALARLSRQQRAVVVLRYVEDLSITATADVLGCSEGTVKVQAARALAALRADTDLRIPDVEEVAR